jgi:hypothetical protein
MQGTGCDQHLAPALHFLCALLTKYTAFHSMVQHIFTILSLNINRPLPGLVSTDWLYAEVVFNYLCYHCNSMIPICPIKQQ